MDGLNNQGLDQGLDQVSMGGDGQAIGLPSAGDEANMMGDGNIGMGADMGQAVSSTIGGQPGQPMSPPGQVPMGQPSMGQPSMGQPSMGQPSMGQPSMGQPSMPPISSMGQPGQPMGQPGQPMGQSGQPMGQPGQPMSPPLQGSMGGQPGQPLGQMGQPGQPLQSGLGQSPHHMDGVPGMGSMHSMQMGHMANPVMPNIPSDVGQGAYGEAAAYSTGEDGHMDKKVKTEGETIINKNEIEVKLLVKGTSASYTMKLDTTTITTVEELKSNLATQLSIANPFTLKLKNDPTKNLMNISDIPNESEIELIQTQAAPILNMGYGQPPSAYPYPSPYPYDGYRMKNPRMPGMGGYPGYPGTYAGYPVHNQVIDVQLDERFKDLLKISPPPPALTDKLPASKTPIIDAFIYCAICGWGVQIIPGTAKFQLTDYEKYWMHSAKVCSKPSPTKVKVARLKALKRWFNDFPGVRKLSALKDNSAQLEVNVKPERFQDILQVVKRLVQILKTRCRSAYPMYFPVNSM